MAKSVFKCKERNWSLWDGSHHSPHSSNISSHNLNSCIDIIRNSEKQILSWLLLLQTMSLRRIMSKSSMWMAKISIREKFTQQTITIQECETMRTSLMVTLRTCCSHDLGLIKESHHWRISCGTFILEIRARNLTKLWLVWPLWEPQWRTYKYIDWSTCNCNNLPTKMKNFLVTQRLTQGSIVIPSHWKAKKSL